MSGSASIAGMQEALSSIASGAGPPIVSRLSEVMGAGIRGADLSKDLSRSIEAIKSLLVQYHLLVFRRQTISGDELREFSTHFGPPIKQIFREANGKALSNVHS